MANNRVGIFGLGAMGFGMAGALHRAGLTVHGHTVSGRWRRAG